MAKPFLKLSFLAQILIILTNYTCLTTLPPPYTPSPNLTDSKFVPKKAPKLEI